VLNLVTPEHHRALAPWINYGVIMSRVGIPAQIWRTLVGAGILYGMVRSLSLFQIETDRLLRAAEEKKLLEAQRELACMNQIAITLGRARDPVQAMAGVLGHLLPFLRCASGEIALRDDEGGGWRMVARMGPGSGLPEAGVSPLIGHAAQTAKLLAHDLRPPALDDLGVISCIRRFGGEMALRAGVRWEMDVTGPAGRLSRDTEIGLYRIAQDAIRNVERHARARELRVELRYGSESVTLQVRDDGRGMSPRVRQGTPAAKGRLDLVGMQERAALLGGQFTIDSQPGGGTTITVTVPRSLELVCQGARSQGVVHTLDT